MSIQHIKTSVENVVSYLTDNPEEAVGKGATITAVMEGGLRCRASAPDGRTIVTDMLEAVGGEGAEPSPGWLFGAALATCDATRIALQAARVGVTLDTLEVSVESEYDDRGLFDMDKNAPAGPLHMVISVKIGAAGVDEKPCRKSWTCLCDAHRLVRASVKPPEPVWSWRLSDAFCLEGASR